MKGLDRAAGICAMSRNASWRNRLPPGKLGRRDVLLPWSFSASGMVKPADARWPKGKFPIGSRSGSVGWFAPMDDLDGASNYRHFLVEVMENDGKRMQTIRNIDSSSSSYDGDVLSLAQHLDKTVHVMTMLWNSNSYSQKIDARLNCEILLKKFNHVMIRWRCSYSATIRSSDRILSGMIILQRVPMFECY